MYSLNSTIHPHICAVLDIIVIFTMYACVHVRTYICMYCVIFCMYVISCMHTQSRYLTHTNTPSVHTHPHAHTHTHCTHMHTHTYIHIHVRTYIHAHDKCALTQTHTFVCNLHFVKFLCNGRSLNCCAVIYLACI